VAAARGSDAQIRIYNANLNKSDQIWFSSYIFEKMSPGPKKWLESCVSRFSTIYAKNQVLKLKIDKVTVIRVI
jgi:hypothetical protein